MPAVARLAAAAHRRFRALKRHQSQSAGNRESLDLAVVGLVASLCRDN
jgi:hypothetical protein